MDSRKTITAMKIFKSTCIIAAAFFCTTAGFSQTATVKGVVTYYFNQYQGDKPDIGAKVYAVDSASYFQNYKVIDSFQLASSFKSILNSNLSIAESYKTLMKRTKGKKKMVDSYNDYEKRYNEAVADVDLYTAKLSAMNVLSKEGFEELDKRTVRALFEAKQDSRPNTTVDGSGNYTLSLSPNVYYVLIISDNRTRLSISEIGGSFAIRKVNLTKNTNAEFSTKFDL